MNMSIRAVLLGAVLAVGAAMPAAAQDVSLGYQFQRLSGGGESENLPMGFNVDASGPFGSGNLSVVGQFDWSRKTASDSSAGVNSSGSVTVSLFGGGVRWSSMSNPKATSFVQGLIGVARSKFSLSCEVAGVNFCAGFDESTTDMAIQIGGGVAVPLNAKASVVGQVDFRRLFTEGEGTNSIRFVGGVRIKL